MKDSTPDRRLLADLKERRPPERRRAYTRLDWFERLTSLWAPVLTFAIVFAPYVLLVELSYDSHTWAQPLLKQLGLLMVAWFVVLLVERLARPEYRRLRRARVEAHELLSQLDRELARHRSPDPGVRAKLTAQAVAVDEARLGRDRAALEGALGKLGQLADKLLPGWRKRTTIDGVKGLAWTLLFVVLLRTLFVEPYKIPTGSMLPTLQLGDHVVVNRFLYGVRIPFVNVVPFQIVRAPERGDVIVFNNPADTSLDFIKRVIGVPGDRIELIDDVVYLNGTPQPRRLVDEQYAVWNREQGVGPWELEPVRLYEETLDGHPHAVLSNPYQRPEKRQGPYVVPEGHVFVMGDNRDNSSDSRVGFGVPPHLPMYVPYGNIKGKAMVIWLSLARHGLGSSIPFWPFDGAGLRTDRLFTPVR